MWHTGVYNTINILDGIIESSICMSKKLCESSATAIPLHVVFWLLVRSHHLLLPLRYLVSRGSLLLSVFNAAGEQQLLSLQQAMEMMVSPACMI